MKRYRSFMSDYDCLQIALTVKLKTVGPGHFKVYPTFTLLSSVIRHILLLKIIK